MGLRSLIVRGVWGSGLDTLLRDLREVIKTQGGTAFPVAAIERAMSRRGKPLTVTEALVDDILNLSYGKARTFAVLASLFPHVDTRNQFHVDHVFPAVLFDKKSLRREKNDDGAPRFTSEEIDDLVDMRDRLPNLQLLPGLENIGKSAKAPDEWLVAEYSSADEQSAFLSRNSLPQSLPHSAGEFMNYFDERRTKLTARIYDVLRAQAPDPLATDTTTLVDLNEELAEGDDSD